MTPVQPQRIEVIDVLRGFSILGILLVNVSSFAGHHASLHELEPINRVYERADETLAKVTNRPGNGTITGRRRSS